MRRFYTGNGDLVGWRHAGVPLVQAIQRKLFGKIPELPWIPISARHALEKVIQKDWRGYEVGSGMSTIWLSSRLAHLTSLEADKEWYAKLRGIIAERGINNVDLRYEWVGHVMSDFTGIPDGSLDFLLIDGGPRFECLTNGFKTVRGGGFIYLDNTDNPTFWPGLANFLSERTGIIRVTKFIDFVPAQFSASEGMLIEKLD